ncbi:MAG: class I SAM-dependent methyltransferase [Phycisphaeraceae bacterium]
MTTLMDPQTQTSFDQAKAEAFAGSLLETLNRGGLTLMISIGHRTGLFDTMADLPWSGSQEIAQAASLNERYVREWLGAMVTGRIVAYDAAQETYCLPAEHAAYLTRAAAADNIARTMQWIAVLGYVEDKIVDKFKHGGGVQYCEYHRFHEVMAAESEHSVASALRPHILPLAPGLLDDLEAGIEVLEIGCGSGGASCRLAEMFPNSVFTAYDLCEDAIAAANATKAARRLTNVTFATRDVSQPIEPQRYDAVLAFDVIHDQRNPAMVLQRVRAALKPGGVFLMQDIAASSHLEKNLDLILGPLFYTISTMHCMTVSLAQNGAGLGTVWGQELAVQMLGDTGFQHVQVHKLKHDIMNNYYIAR